MYRELLRSNRLSIVGVASCFVIAGITVINSSIAMAAIAFPAIYFIYYYVTTKQTIAYLQTNYGI